MKKWLFLIFSGFLFVISCKRAQNIEVKVPNTEFYDSVASLPVPDPYGLAKAMKFDSILYNSFLLNSPESSAVYLTQKSEALNLGIYGTDLSYSSLYGDGELTTKYYKVSKQLSNELGIINLFSHDLIQKIENNINNPDSLYEFAKQNFRKLYNYLVSRGSGGIATLVLTGAEIESMYLAVANDSIDPQKVKQMILSQADVIHKLTNLLTKYSTTNDDVAAVLEIIKPLDVLMRSVTKKHGKYVITDSQWNKIKFLIKKIRYEFVHMH
jgi:hypothetical protein